MPRFCTRACAYVKPIRLTEYISAFDIFNISDLIVKPHALTEALFSAMPESNTHSPKLLDQVRQVCQRRQYSYHTEKAYVRWAERFVRFHDTTHPRHLDEEDIRAFLNHLASDRNVAASTQNQALNALVFLYEQVLDEVLDNIGPLDPTVPSDSPRCSLATKCGACSRHSPPAQTGSLPIFSTAVACVSRRPCASGSKSSTLPFAASMYGMEKGERTERPCSPSAFIPPSSVI